MHCLCFVFTCRAVRSRRIISNVYFASDTDGVFLTACYLVTGGFFQHLVSDALGNLANQALSGGGVACLVPD